MSTIRTLSIAHNKIISETLLNDILDYAKWDNEDCEDYWDEIVHKSMTQYMLDNDGVNDGEETISVHGRRNLTLTTPLTTTLHALFTQLNAGQNSHHTYHTEMNNATLPSIDPGNNLLNVVVGLGLLVLDGGYGSLYEVTERGNCVFRGQEEGGSGPDKLYKQGVRYNRMKRGREGFKGYLDKLLIDCGVVVQTDVHDDHDGHDGHDDHANAYDNEYIDEYKNILNHCILSGANATSNKFDVTLQSIFDGIAKPTRINDMEYVVYTIQKLETFYKTDGVTGEISLQRQLDRIGYWSVYIYAVVKSIVRLYEGWKDKIHSDVLEECLYIGECIKDEDVSVRLLKVIVGFNENGSNDSKSNNDNDDNDNINEVYVTKCFERYMKKVRKRELRVKEERERRERLYGGGRVKKKGS
jgi:hypothetical protein